MASIPTLYTEIPVRFDPPIENVLIALPHNINKAIKKLPLANNDFSQRLNQLKSNDENSTFFGSFYSVVAKDAIISQLSYEINNNSKDMITLTPFFLNNSLSLDYRSISFQLPSSIIYNCISISEDELENDILVVDILIDIDILITLKLNLKSFISDDFLKLANFHSWCRYSMPYSFNHRKPLFIKALDSSTSLISLIDGGLLKLSRSNPLDDYLVVPFTSTSYFDSFRFNIFSSSRKTNDTNNNNNNIRIPESLEFNKESVSTKSIIDIVKFDEDTFLTLSIDKKLTLWSLSSKSVLKVYNMNEFLDSDLHSSILSPYLPKSFLHIDNDILTVFLPVESSFLKIFKFVDGDLDLINSISPSLPNTTWLPLDYQIKASCSGLKIWFAWYFGECTLFQQCEILNDGQINWNLVANESIVNDMIISDFMGNVETSTNMEDLNLYCLRYVQYNYNDLTLSLAIDLFNSHYRLNLEDLSTVEKINQIIFYNVEDDDKLINLKKQWLKFTNVCQDIQIKSNKRLFAISIDSLEEDDPFLLVLKNNQYSIIKKSTKSELLLFNASKSVSLSRSEFDNTDVDLIDLQKLVQLILNFSKVFSNNQIQEIKDLLNSNLKSTDSPKLMTMIFDKTIVNTVDESVASNLLSTLSSIPSALELMNYLSTLPFDSVLDYKPISNVKLGSLGRSLIHKSLERDLISIDHILIGLLLIVLTVDISDPMIELFTKLFSLYKSLSLLKIILTLANQDLALSYFDDIYHGVLIRSSNLNYILTDSLSHFCNSNAIIFICSTLLSNSQPELASELICYLPENSPIGSLLHGLILIQLGRGEESKKIFINSSYEITQYSSKITSEERNFLKPIWSIANLILHSSRVDYFFNLSLIFEKQGLDKISLELSLQSLEANITLKMLQDDTEILSKIFQISLKLNEFELAFDSITKMKPVDRILPLKNFIYKLFQINQLTKILEFSYGEDFDRVDQLIYDLGEENIGTHWRSALKYYRVCYALRLKEGDLRGAVDALYRFNTIANSKDVKDIKLLLDNYLIICNVLNTINDKSDRWIIKKSVGNNDKDQLITYDVLEEEYKDLAFRYDIPV